MKMRMAAWLLCFILAATSCGKQEKPKRDDRTINLSVVSGRAEITGTAGRVAGPSNYELAPGDEVSLSKDGIAELRLGRGRRVEIAGGTVRVVSERRIVLESGKLLADVSRSLFVDADSVAVSAESSLFRIDKDLSARVGVYEGTVRAGAPGDFINVARFRQIVVAGDVVPRAAEPLEFTAEDLWDRRLLARAIDLDSRLSNFSRGLEAQLGHGEGLDFFAGLTAAGSQVDFLAPYLHRRRSDILIGLLTAVQSLERLPGDLKHRFVQVFDLSLRGATWGLIAVEFQVPADKLFEALGKAVERSGIQVIGAGPGLLRPPATVPRRAGAQPSATSAPRPSSPSRPAPVPSPGRSPLLPGVGEVSPPLKMILDDLLGVVDPGKTLPGLI